jgi:hypothetical protein
MEATGGKFDHRIERYALLAKGTIGKKSPANLQITHKTSPQKEESA